MPHPMNMKYSQEEIDKARELGYSYSTAFDGVFIKLEAMEDNDTVDLRVRKLVNKKIV